MHLRPLHAYLSLYLISCLKPCAGLRHGRSIKVKTTINFRYGLSVVLTPNFKELLSCICCIELCIREDSVGILVGDFLLPVFPSLESVRLVLMLSVLLLSIGKSESSSCSVLRSLIPKESSLSSSSSSSSPRSDI